MEIRFEQKANSGLYLQAQRPIENYIVDFVCLSLNFIIEVDGYSHQIPENEEKDKAREDRLKELGFTVIRFKDEEVLRHINMVRENIEGWVKKLTEDSESEFS